MVCLVYDASRAFISSQQFFKLLLIETDDRLAVDDDHRSRHCAYLFKLIDCRRIFGYVLLFKNNATLRKGLLRSAAEQSARLAIDHHSFSHCITPC